MVRLYLKHILVITSLVWNGQAGGSGSGSVGGSDTGVVPLTYPNKACWMRTKDVPFHNMGKQGLETKTDILAARKCFEDGHCSSHVWRFFLKKHRLEGRPEVELLYYPPDTMTWVPREQVESKEVLVIAPNKLFCRYTNERGNVIIGTKENGTTGNCIAKPHNETVDSGPNYELLAFNGCANGAKVDNATAQACPPLPNTCLQGSTTTTTTTLSPPGDPSDPHAGGASSSSGDSAGSSSGGTSGSVGGSGSVDGGGSAGSSGGGSGGTSGSVGESGSVDGGGSAGSSGGGSGGSSGHPAIFTPIGMGIGGYADTLLIVSLIPHLGLTFRNPACWLSVNEAKSQYMGPQGSETSTATYASRHCNNGTCKNLIGRFHLRDDLIAKNENVQLLYYPPGSMKWVPVGQNSSGDIPLEFEDHQMLCRFVNTRNNTIIGISINGPSAKKECKAKDIKDPSPTYEILYFNACENSAVNNAVPTNCTSMPGCPVIEQGGDNPSGSGPAGIIH